MITLDPLTLLNAAQQLDARCDPLFVAQELRALVASAPVVDAELYADLIAEFRATSECRGKLHGAKPCECRPCAIARRIK